MNTPIELEDVIAYLRESQGAWKRKAITAATLLEDDLGITGDDGVELLEEIQKRFEVSFIGADGTLREAFGLAPDEYLFHSEGFSLIKLFGFGREKVKTLSVGFLHQVIIEQQQGKK